MHDIGFFADIRYANILQLIWLIWLSYLFMTTAFEQNESDTSYWMLLSLRQSQQKPTTRTNLACFTSDKVSKLDVCQQGTCDTWRRPGRLIKETAACYFNRLLYWRISACWLSDN